MASMSRSCAPAVAEVGAVTGPILDSKICRWPGLAGREDCPLPWRPTKRPRDAHLSHHPVSSHYSRSPHISDVRNGQFGAHMLCKETGPKPYTRCLFDHRRQETRLMSHVSSHPSHVIVSSFVVRMVTEVASDLAVLSQVNHVNRRRVPRRPHERDLRYYGANATSVLNGSRLFWPNAQSRNSIQASHLHPVSASRRTGREAFGQQESGHQNPNGHDAG